VAQTDRSATEVAPTRSFRDRVRALRSWAARYMLVGGLLIAIDVSVVVLGVEILHLPRVLAIVVGALAGTGVGFVLNKYFVFRDRGERAGTQAVRYAAATVLEFATHAGLAAALIHGVGVHYVVAKAVSDVVAFNALHLLLMRYFVFRTASIQWW
jgi:putative flippase GtrA